MPSAEYIAQRDAAGRTPFYLVELTVNRCGLEYTTSPCQAVDLGDGARCSFSYFTCQDRDNFDSDGAGGTVGTTQTFRFHSAGVQVPPVFHTTYSQLWPLVEKVSHLTSELDPDKGLTLPEKMTVSLLPIITMGIGTHPPQNTDKSGLINTSVAGHFWRTFLFIHPNIRTATVTIKKGFVSSAFVVSDLESLWKGTVSSIDVRADGRVNLQCRDLFAHNLAKVPPPISTTNTVQAAVARDGSTVAVFDASEFTDPADITGKVVIEVETITGRMELAEVGSIASNTLTITKGLFGTPKEPWAKGATITEVWAVASEGPTASGDNGIRPLTALADLLNRAGIPAGDIDSTQWTAEAVWIGPVLIKGIIRKPTLVKKLTQQILRLFSACIYEDESLKLRVHVNAPPTTTETVGTVADDPNILISKPPTTQAGEDKRLTHVSVFYDKEEDGDDFRKVAAAINATTFTELFYGATEKDRRELKVETPWLQSWQSGHAELIAFRLLLQRDRHRAFFEYEAELRDETQVLGELVDLTTNDLQDAVGADRTVRCAVVKKKWSGIFGFRFTLEETGFGRAQQGEGEWRFGSIGPSGSADYDSASSSEQADGAWIADASGNVGTGDDGAYYLY